VNRNTADHATHRSVRGSLNGNERTGRSRERTQQDQPSDDILNPRVKVYDRGTASIVDAGAALLICCAAVRT